MNKQLKLSIVLTIVIIINYLLTRFFLYDIHKMKDFSDIMSLLACCVTFINILSKNYISSLFSSVGNIIGFVTGYILKKEVTDFITGNANNMWLIWLTTYIVLVVMGTIINRMFHVKHINNDD